MAPSCGSSAVQLTILLACINVRMGWIATPQAVTCPMSHDIHLFTPLSHWVPSWGHGGMKPGWLRLAIQAVCSPSPGGAIHAVAMSSCRGKPFASRLSVAHPPSLVWDPRHLRPSNHTTSEYLVSIYDMPAARLCIELPPSHYPGGCFPT